MVLRVGRWQVRYYAAMPILGFTLVGWTFVDDCWLENHNLVVLAGHISLPEIWSKGCLAPLLTRFLNDAVRYSLHLAIVIGSDIVVILIVDSSTWH